LKIPVVTFCPSKSTSFGRETLTDSILGILQTPTKKYPLIIDWHVPYG
jgi:hypothetical protein